uniref:Uncharacterized protein n=1 Tax=Arundo donax TaxID=35708 RepID=A0A0A8Z2K4_ARUDO
MQHLTHKDPSEIRYCRNNS